MKIIECEQGHADWFAARAGTITASMFVEVRKRVNGLNKQQAVYVEAIQADMSKDDALELSGFKSAPRADVVARALAGEKVGDYTNAALKYANKLALERINGAPLEEEQFETWAMRRGKELEPDARLLHEERVGMMIQEVGLVMSDCGRFGASADGFIGDNTGVEYKCLINADRVFDVVTAEDLSDFMDQMQGGMWITGRDFWHFGLYCPFLKNAGKELIIREVLRDEKYIEALAADLEDFDKVVEKQKALILDAFGGDDPELAFATQPEKEQAA